MQAPIFSYSADDVKRGSRIREYQGTSGEVAFLCFDYQGLVNTANDPSMNNLRAQWRLKDEISQFVALRDIHPGEELFQGYTSPEVLN